MQSIQDLIAQLLKEAEKAPPGIKEKKLQEVQRIREALEMQGQDNG